MVRYTPAAGPTAARGSTSQDKTRVLTLSRSGYGDPVRISSPSPLSLQRRVLVLRAAANLFGSELMHPKLHHVLRNQSVDYAKIVDRTGPICMRRAAFDFYDGTFELDEQWGEWSLIIGVHGTDAEALVDLCGWPIMHPETFAPYFGFAGLLGSDAVINPASFVEEPCPIWSTPLSWLQSDLRGCVVLNPFLAAPVLAQAPGSFQCEGKAHAQWLVGTGAIAALNLKIPMARAAA